MDQATVNPRTSRRQVRHRGLVVGAGVLAGALMLSACGSPSPGQSFGQNLAAGVAAQSAGDYTAATNDYNAALAAEPTNARALFDLGDVEQAEHLDTQAKTHYIAALAVYPNFVAALFNLATLEASSSLSEAEALYQQVIELSPKDADAHFNLGYVLVSLGRKAAGLSEINQGIKLDPSLAKRVAGTTTTTTTAAKG